ncbi:MAG: YbgC/FadM family acyl-CoA thioesterase [Proteobacteria bacterium]|nr:YbgC/FadM family acyl-CoA thioesterase [Pseudomonadota bacterium]
MNHRSDYRFFDRLRVRWAEVDMQKIVFNGHYLMYFDTAIAGYWRALALPYHETMELLQGDLYVRKATVEYEGSARYDDQLQVAVRCARIGNSSLVFEGAVLRGDERLVRGELVYVFADPATMASRPVPPDLREVLLGFEAGKPMVDVRVGPWDELGREAQKIRAAVFIDEQKIPAEMEWDAADAGCLHAVAYNRFGMPLATGRLLEHVPGTAKIGRMAVLPAMRGSHIGRAVLDALMVEARARGDREVLLHAQLSAAPFYLRAGFQPRGPQFDEAGIAHVEMVRGL